MDEHNQQPMNMRKAGLIAASVVVLIFGVSIAFFFLTDGMDEFYFDEYISVYLTVDGARFRFDVDNYVQVVDVAHFDQSGQLLLSALRLEGAEMSVAMFNLISRAIDDGILIDRDNVSTNIRQPRNPDGQWLARIEYELHGLRGVLSDWLFVTMREV